MITLHLGRHVSSNEISFNQKKFKLRQHSNRRSRDFQVTRQKRVTRTRPSKLSASRVYEMVAIANACTEWIVFGQVELDKDDAATIDVMRRALLPSNACVPALPVRRCWYPDSDI